VLTFYDDATGERTELSAATLANWVAKTANLLVDGLGLGPGSVAAVRLPAHWQTAAVLLGCWSAGLSIDLGDPSGVPGHADVAFVTVDPNGVPADETYALSLAPMGLPFRPGPPAGTLDYTIEVRAFGDHFAAAPPSPDRPALTDGTTHGDLARAVSDLLPGGRVLIDGDAHPDPRYWLVEPLLAGTSVVLCRHLDPAKVEARLAAEHATPR
jgi:uncharacterized protein (TIGR03089 family)